MSMIRRRSLRRAGLLLALLPLSAFAAMQEKAVEWRVGEQAFGGVLVYDDASAEKRPGLVMVPDWLGVTPDAVAQARKVAGDDYVILVADMYGKDVRPKNPDEAQAQVKMLYADPAAMRARVAKAVDVLEAQAAAAPLDASRIGAFGYCFGGASVLELARSGARLAGIVSFHGGLKTALPATPDSVKTPLLVLNGAEDRGTAADVAGFKEEMDAGGADWTFVDFSGAVHCFALESANRPPGCVYDPRAAKRAYRMMDGFFEERFGAN